MNETDITEALVLAPDVGLVAVDELSLALRRQLAAQPGDHAVTRRLARDHSKLIGADAAALLEHFRHPITIVDAVIAFSDRRGIDPEQTLEQAFPLLQALLRSRFLVDARSPHASPVKSLFRVGEPFGDLTIVERVQCLDDTEVYKAVGSDGTMVALKVLRRPDDDALRAALEREVLVLAHFNDVAASGTVARGQGGRPDAGEGHRIVPRLVGAGNHHDLPYVQTEWVDGSSADAIAENLRSYRNIDTLFDVCLAIIDTYAQLHRLGIVHGDVHPGNIIVANSTAITLVDFGSASISGCDDRSQTPARQGVAQYFEPEFARSVLTGASNPRATFHSDQYALAAVLYLLLAGQHHLPLSTHKTAMLRQIAYEQPILDDELVVSSGLDTVLRRALATESDRRHSSTAEFGRAFRRAVGDSRRRFRAAQRRGAEDSMHAFVQQTLQRLRGSTIEDMAPPRCSVALGAGGVAYLFYRAALHREDPDLLAHADIWCTAAAGSAQRHDAFESEEMGIAATTIGEVSVLHGIAGLSVLQALVARAFGADSGLRHAVSTFVSHHSATAHDLDFVCGRPGSLAAACSLLELFPAADPGASVAALLDFGADAHRAISARLEALAPVAICEEYPSLGISHGWAGVLYASLRWRRACALHGHIAAVCDTDRPLQTRLDELAQCAVPAHGGLAWEWRTRYPEVLNSNVFDAGWCNGSAGMVSLWLLAFEEFHEQRYLELAHNAATHCANAPATTADLCCGTVGRGYAMLAMHKHTAEEKWMQRARTYSLEALARSQETRRNSLYKGDLGLACLLMDLAAPASATMPFFGSTGY